MPTKTVDQFDQLLDQRTEAYRALAPGCVRAALRLIGECVSDAFPEAEKVQFEEADRLSIMHLVNPDGTTVDGEDAVRPHDDSLWNALSWLDDTTSSIWREVLRPAGRDEWSVTVSDLLAVEP